MFKNFSCRIVSLAVCLLFFAASYAFAEDIEALKKTIEDHSVKDLPNYLGKKAIPLEIIDAANLVTESTDKILNSTDANEKDKYWAIQRKAVALIILAYNDVSKNYKPLILIGDELEQQGLKKLAGIVEKHILLIAETLAIETKPAENPGDKGINLQSLADRIILYAENYPGPESEQLMDTFLLKINTMTSPIQRDKRLAVIAPIFQKYFLSVNHTAKAASLQPCIDRSTLVGKPMALIGVDLDGNDFDLNTIKDKVVLVQFWGTWCIPCREEIPELIRLYEKYHSRGFEILGINTAVKGDENPAGVRRFIETQLFNGKKIPYPILHEGLSEKKYQMTISNQYGISELPVLILIGKNGKVGKLHPLPSTLDDQIAEALSLGASLEFTEEERKQIEEQKKKREAEEQKKIEEELKQ